MFFPQTSPPQPQPQPPHIDDHSSLVVAVGHNPANLSLYLVGYLYSDSALLRHPLQFFGGSLQNLSSPLNQVQGRICLNCPELRDLNLNSYTNLHPGASYCACNSGVSDAVLQKSIDYACENGADCTQIQQNGACYNPSTVKNHCDYAVNSYYQKKGQVSGSCDFDKTASVVPTAPPGQSSTCVYPSSSASGGIQIFRLRLL